MTNVVAVQQRRRSTGLEKLTIEFVRDRALSASTQPGEPHHDTSLAEQLFTRISGDGLFVPNDIFRGFRVFPVLVSI